MGTTTITISVEAEAAKAFAAASPDEQRKMQLLLGLRLQDLTMSQGKSLQAVMDEIGARQTFDWAMEHGTLLISSAIVAELNDVLRRPRFDAYVYEDERLAFSLHSCGTQGWWWLRGRGLVGTPSVSRHPGSDSAGLLGAIGWLRPCSKLPIPAYLKQGILL